MSRKPRKQHEQMAIEFKTWGGKRVGAGRKSRKARPGEPHTTREKFAKLTPAHVTLRLVAGFGTLRMRAAYFAIRKATKAVLRRSDFRIVHLSPEDEHLHLIVEAENDQSLWKGIQAFQSSAAQHLNRAIGNLQASKRRGSVFDDRYHARLITSPMQARNCIAYVLNNWRRHDQDEVSEAVRYWDVDYFSSAVSFTGWAELAEKPFMYTIPPDQRLCVAAPQSWLLHSGWRKAGPISMYQVPGPRR